MRATAGRCSSGQRGEGCRSEGCYFQHGCIVLLPHVRWLPTELHIFWRCDQKYSENVKHPEHNSFPHLRSQTSERNQPVKPAGSSCQTGGLSHHMHTHVSSLTGLQRHIVRSQRVWRKVKGALTSLLAHSYSHVGKSESHMPRLPLVISPRLGRYFAVNLKDEDARAL